MRTEMKLLSVSLVAAATLGMVGCGGSDAPAAENPPAPVVVVPDYAKKVTADGEVAGKIANALREDMTTSSAKAKIEILSKIAISPNALPAGQNAPGGEDPEEEEGEIELTLSCAYEGNYTIHMKNEYNEMNGIVKVSRFASISFENCVHDEMMIDGFDFFFHEDQTHEARFSYTGEIANEGSYVDVARTRVEEKHNSVAKNFVSKITLDGVLREFQSLDGAMTWEGKYSELTYLDKGNANFLLKDLEYKGDGSLDEGISWEVKAFTWDEKEYTDIERRVYVLNGYQGLSEYNATVPDGKLVDYDYYENYQTTRERDGQVSTRTIDGVYGTLCLGGAVELETTLAIENNSSQEDVKHLSNVTPFAGVLQIQGADSKAALTFGETSDDPKLSYVQLSVDGADVGGQQSLSDLRKDCPQRLR